MEQFDPMSLVDDTGFSEVPTRYDTSDLDPDDFPGLEPGMEAIDYIRRQLGDTGFYSFCRGQYWKYSLRCGKKAGTDDAEKARFYELMAGSVRGENPDPREYRNDGE